jgi:hypothetical protein
LQTQPSPYRIIQGAIQDATRLCQEQSFDFFFVLEHSVEDFGAAFFYDPKSVYDGKHVQSILELRSYPVLAETTCNVAVVRRQAIIKTLGRSDNRMSTNRHDIRRVGNTIQCGWDIAREHVIIRRLVV